MLDLSDKIWRSINLMMDDAGKVLLGYFGARISGNYKADRSIVTEADLKSEAIILSRIRADFPDDLVYSEESGLSSKIRHEGSHIWIVDPLDGSANFSNGYPFFCVSIARGLILPDKRIEVLYGAIFDPARQKKYLAERTKGAWCNGRRVTIGQPRALAQSFLVTGFYYRKGEELQLDIDRFTKVAQICPSIRRDGAAALDLALVAEGIYDGFWETGLQPWDVAAGGLIAAEAGAIVKNYFVTQDQPFDIENSTLIAGTQPVVEEISALLV